MKNTGLLIFIMIVFPGLAMGSTLRITEIMYDAPGTDSTNEWIEVLNTGESSIDLTTYKFFENNTAHSITALGTLNLLEAGQYAIIADNAENFKNNYPNLPTSNIYDSVFSLSNSAGEYLAIKDSAGEITHEITYSPAVGANGDGNTLHISSTNSIIAGIPSPLGSEIANNDNTNTSSTAKSTATNSSPNNSDTVVPQRINSKFVFTHPGITIANSPVLFKAILYGNSGEIIDRGEFTWNFGDGQIVNTNHLVPVEHTYFYPGDYTISLSYKYAWSVSPIFINKTKITIISSPFELTNLYAEPVSAVGIKNNRDSEYDLSSYMIRTGHGLVTVPKNTFVGAKDEIYITLPKYSYTKNNIVLLDPAGYQVSDFNQTSVKDSLVANVSAVSNQPRYDNVFASPARLASFEKFEPRIINTEPEELNTSTFINKSSYYSLGVLIFIMIAIFLYIRKQIPSKNDEVSSDDYTLQDE